MRHFMSALDIFLNCGTEMNTSTCSRTLFYVTTHPYDCREYQDALGYATPRERIPGRLRVLYAREYRDALGYTTPRERIPGRLMVYYTVREYRDALGYYTARENTRTP